MLSSHCQSDQLDQALSSNRVLVWLGRYEWSGEVVSRSSFIGINRAPYWSGVGTHLYQVTINFALLKTRVSNMLPVCGKLITRTKKQQEGGIEMLCNSAYYRLQCVTAHVILWEPSVIPWWKHKMFIAVDH